MPGFKEEIQAADYNVLFFIQNFIVNEILLNNYGMLLNIILGTLQL
jgi:hypothetical protein